MWFNHRKINFAARPITQSRSKCCIIRVVLSLSLSLLMCSKNIRISNARQLCTNITDCSVCDRYSGGQNSCTHSVNFIFDLLSSRCRAPSNVSISLHFHICITLGTSFEWRQMIVFTKVYTHNKYNQRKFRQICNAYTDLLHLINFLSFPFYSIFLFAFDKYAYALYTITHARRSGTIESFH